MNELEKYADLKASLHVIMMELAIIKQKQSPTTKVEEHVAQMLSNVQSEKNRIKNEIQSGKNPEWEFSI